MGEIENQDVATPQDETTSQEGVATPQEEERVENPQALLRKKNELQAKLSKANERLKEYENVKAEAKAKQEAIAKEQSEKELIEQGKSAELLKQKDSQIEEYKSKIAEFQEKVEARKKILIKDFDKDMQESLKDSDIKLIEVLHAKLSGGAKPLITSASKPEVERKLLTKDNSTKTERLAQHFDNYKGITI